MRILVLSVTAGEGHNAMGKALINAAEMRHHDTMMLDYFKDASPLRAAFAQPIYFFFLRHFPRFCRRTYVSLSKRDYHKMPGRLSAFGFMTSSKQCNQRILNTIREFKPDMIYCTHVYAAYMMSYFKANHYCDLPTFFIVSDYVPHPYTEHCTKIDYLLTPTTELHPLLKEMGYQDSQFLPIGITVDPKFAMHHDRMRLATSLGIKSNMFTILMISGAVGFGKTISLIDGIIKEGLKVQLIVVNGRNEEAKQRIDEKIQKAGIKNILNYGFVNNVHELMAVSDVMIGKLGGVGITEAFNMGLPVICPMEAPAQEYDNGIYLEKKHCIINAGNNEKALAAIRSLMGNPETLKTMRQNVKAIAKPNAATDLVRFMEELGYARK